MEREHYFEWDPQLEAMRHLSTLDRLLAKLIETGSELDPEERAQLRQRVRQLLGYLGLRELGERGPEGLLEVHQRLNIEVETLPTPPSYPTIQEFQHDLLQVVMSERPGHLLAVPPVVRARDVAGSAQYDWITVQGRGGKYTLDYLYELGKVMVVPTAYWVLFSDHDAISIGHNWWVENGIHRSLTLRTLGPTFVTRQGMDRWVKAQPGK